MRRGSAVAVALAVALVGLAAIAPAASAAGDRIAIRTADQGRALAADALAIRIKVSNAADAALRAGAPGVRRLTERGRVSLRGGAPKRVSLPLTSAGRSALERASSRCKPVTVQVHARVVNRFGEDEARRRSAKRPLGPDPGRCSRPSGPPEALPAPGGGGEAPPGEGVPAPGGGGGGGGGRTSLRAGAATADITPPVGTPMFAYTARSGLANPPRAIQILADPDENLYAKSFEPSDGIHTRLRASTILIERQGERFALAQADLGGIPYALVQAVEQRLAGTGIGGGNLVLSATHTHAGTGPIWPADNMGYASLGGDFFDPRVFEITADGIAESILAAADRLEPANVGIGTADLRGASNNRNFTPFKRNSDVPKDPGAAADASVNPEVTAIRVDAADGEPLGLWSNFALHQTSFGDGNLLFSGDNAATSERLVEREVAQATGTAAPSPAAPGKQDGPVLVWTNGAEGDVSPDGDSRTPDGLAGEPLEYVPSDAAEANLTGRRVAAGVLDAWRDAGARMQGDLELGSRQTFVRFDGGETSQAEGEPVGPIEALGAGGIVARDGTCAPVDNFAGPGQGMKMPLIEGAALVPDTAAVSTLRLGPLGIAALPFEVTTQMGRRISAAIEAESGGALDTAAIAGLSDGYLSYAATPEEYDACHYEGSFTLFGRRLGPLLRDTASSLVPSLLGAGPAPASDPEPPPLGAGAGTLPPLQPTPDAGTTVNEPAAEVRRYERATFTWRGGDPGIDAPRGETFVSLQRRAGGEWRTVGTEEGIEDTTIWNDSAQTWTDTWQFSACDPLGTYRFVATGRAIRAPGAAPARYEVTSQEFELRRTRPLEIIDATVTGTAARVRARYPDPGPALLALPRRVRDGSATISLAGGGEVRAEPDAQGLAFEAPVPEGSVITGVEVTDRCGNSTG